MSTSITERTTRPYLSRSKRKQKLLQIAAEIVEAEGWAALSMVALAERGGTSRQLVYQHFPNLEALLARTAWSIFNDTIVQTRASIEAHPGSLMDAVRAAESWTMDLPPGRGDALWQLIAGTAGSAELEKVGRDVREIILQAWTPVVKKELNLPPKQARVMAWSVVMGFWGTRQLVRDGDVSRKTGITTFNQLVQQLTRNAG